MFIFLAGFDLMMDEVDFCIWRGFRRFRNVKKQRSFTMKCMIIIFKTRHIRGTIAKLALSPDRLDRPFDDLRTTLRTDPASILGGG